MKKLYLIGGPMGVGKTTVCRILKSRLPKAVFLDGDWCWDADPFQVTEETKAMVLENIRFLLQSFLRCSAYENVIFCWVMQEQSTVDAILSGLDTADAEVLPLSLVCDEAALVRRLEGDIAAGCRTPDVIGRSLARLPMYAALRGAKLDVSGLTPEETAERIMAL